MTSYLPSSRVVHPASLLSYVTLNAFPVACFSLTVGTDLVYMQTSNLMWLHFSEWLLLVGTTLAVVTFAFRLVLALAGSIPLGWAAALLRIVVIVLATVNNLVHTIDGWQAVVPLGLSLSAATVVAMMLAGLADRATYRGGYHA